MVTWRHTDIPLVTTLSDSAYPHTDEQSKVRGPDSRMALLAMRIRPSSANIHPLPESSSRFQREHTAGFQIRRGSTKVTDRRQRALIFLPSNSWRSIMHSLSSLYIGAACHPVDGASRTRRSYYDTPPPLLGERCVPSRPGRTSVPPVWDVKSDLPAGEDMCRLKGRRSLQLS